MFSLPSLIAIGIAYLLFLFGTAYLTERGALPNKLVRHPLTHVLSIGVYASALTFYGAFGLASESGYRFLASYFGAVATFVLGPALLIPILRITRSYQLNSLPDLLAFRFRSGAVGTYTSILCVIATLPLLAIQLQAVTEAMHLMNNEFSTHQIALGFCFVIALFSILFGARQANLRASHQGLMVAMAVESLIKLIALVVIALFAFFSVLGGLDGLDGFLSSHPSALAALDSPVDSNSWRTLILAFFTGAIVMPHMFHMLFTENSADETLYKATWAMPLYLFLLALTVPIIMWAGQALAVGGDNRFIILHLGLILDSPWIMVLAFIGGLSAASGIMIVATVAMASMIQNHVILPLIPKPDTTRFYSWLLWVRRILIAALLLTSYLFYLQVGEDYELNHMGIITVSAFLQFLPGLLATLFWQKANRWGLILGLSAGITIWFIYMLLPIFDSTLLDALAYNLSTHSWDQIAIISLLINISLLVAGSLLIPQSEEEARSAQACLMNALQKPLGSSLSATQVSDFTNLLASRLGPKTAEREVNHALESMNLTHETVRPVDLLRLRSTLEQHLSGLLGPIEAAALLEPLDRPSDPMHFKSSNLHLVESQLENYREQMTGLVAELDELRRYHLLTLQKLPIGVCTLSPEGQVLLWNGEMERFTDIPTDQVMGIPLNELPEPWCSELSGLLQQEQDHQPVKGLQKEGKQLWYILHKSMLTERKDLGVAIILEDVTEPRLLHDKLAHSERLASIGRFAAGVAHEIGNPVTGIACLAQNLKLESENPYILETGDQIVDQTKRISKIVQSLVRFAHTGRPDSDREQLPVSLAHCASEAVHLLSLDERGKQINFVNQIDDTLRASGDPQQILQVLVNLLQNACDASPEGGSIWLETEADKHTITLSVTDEGSGISPELQTRLFEPFFTTKEPGKGTGLGLSLVYNIIEEHYGTIEILSPANNKQNKGTQVVITLPKLSPEEEESGYRDN